eukprot:7949172-Pyramimonas_sp.AAC.1
MIGSGFDFATDMKPEAGELLILVSNSAMLMGAFSRLVGALRSSKTGKIECVVMVDLHADLMAFNIASSIAMEEQE